MYKQLANIQTARMGNVSRPDEPTAFESREALRLLVIGKEVAFTISYTIPASSGGPALEFGELVLVGAQEVNVVDEMVRTGWAKVKEGRKNEEGEGADRRAALVGLEDEARKSNKGLWSPEAKAVRCPSAL